MTITANTLLAALHEKHPVDKWVCVTECKTGSTWMSATCPRLDFWVMARSWAKPRFIGYEIKVNRSDFIRDDKWPAYLRYCRELYLVAPPGIIDVSECPRDVGLMISTKTGSRLYTKKRAPVRMIDIPRSLLIYILMSRTVIVSDMYHTTPKVEGWKNYLAEKKTKHGIGHSVSYKIRQAVEKRVQDIISENQRLNSENELLESIKQFLSELGIDPSRKSSWAVRRNINEALSALPPNLISTLEKSNVVLADTIKELKTLDNGGAK